MESNNILYYNFLRWVMWDKILNLAQYQCAYQENFWVIGKRGHFVEKVKKGFEIYLNKWGTFLWCVTNHEDTGRTVLILCANEFEWFEKNQ